MFAYCGNNPIARLDHKGQYWGFWFPFIVPVTPTGYMLSNYYHNSAVDSDPETTTQNKLINDQNLETGKNFKYGNYDVAWNGCEAIAVHNAAVLLGKESSLSNTIKDFQYCLAMIGDGYLGSNPYVIGRVLDKRGIPYVRVGLDEITQKGIYIISYWTDGVLRSTIHTVTVVYDGSTYTTYNLYGRGKLHQGSPADYASDYICGYRVG
jgi:hypothetical protein